jgi:hypothetical protein
LKVVVGIAEYQFLFFIGFLLLAESLHPKVMLTYPASSNSPRLPMQLMKIRAPPVLLESNPNAATPVANPGILLPVFLAHEIRRGNRNSNAIRALNTLDSVVFLLGFHFLGFCALLATLLRTLAVLGSFGFFRSHFAFLAGSRFVYATAWGSSAVGGGGGSRDFGALERVPAGAEGAAVFVAELEGDFVNVELRKEERELGILSGVGSWELGVGSWDWEGWREMG